MDKYDKAVFFVKAFLGCAIKTRQICRWYKNPLLKDYYSLIILKYKNRFLYCSFITVWIKSFNNIFRWLNFGKAAGWIFSAFVWLNSQINAVFNHLNANPTNLLLPTNYFSVFDHFVGLALKRLKKQLVSDSLKLREKQF